MHRQAGLQHCGYAHGEICSRVCQNLPFAQAQEFVFGVITHRCSSVLPRLQRKRRALYVRWILKHLRRQTHGDSERSERHATLLLCLKHSIMPSRLKDGPLGLQASMTPWRPPMFPSSCSGCLYPQHVPLPSLSMRTSYSQGVCRSVSPYYNFPLLSAARWKMTH
jgi:hypothetical protein